MSEKSRNKELFFTRRLLKWHFSENHREMPWKFEKDPYKIWLSEIILQQTRVEQGINYYNRFIKKYPNIHKLAKAPEEDVLKLWEGLGYYSRCKNLIATARYISTELQGVFPDSFENIIKLKGIGPYTAAAIASFAFQKPHAVVDGNVMRILARYFCIESTLHSTKGKKVFNEIAQILLDKKQPAIYNQAIMDFGATVCKPQIPSCEKCMLALHCEAFNKNRVAQFPIKHKKPEKKKRWFFYVIIEHNKQYYVQIRDKKDIWQELAEFYLIEKTKNYSIDQILKTDDFFTKIKNLYTVTSMSEQYIQHLSHQTIYCTFIHINLSQKKTFGSGTFMNLAQLKKIAFPKTITSYFSETSFFNVGK